MANKTVSFRLPTELVEAIESHAKATGQSKTNVVIEALAQFYEIPHSITQSVIPNQVQEQLNELKHQIALLSEANKLQQLITGEDPSIQPSTEVNAVISSMPFEGRLAWVYGVLTEAARKQIMLQSMEPNISGERHLKLISHAKD